MSPYVALDGWSERCGRASTGGGTESELFATKKHLQMDTLNRLEQSFLLFDTPRPPVEAPGPGTVLVTIPTCRCVHLENASFFPGPRMTSSVAPARQRQKKPGRWATKMEPISLYAQLPDASRSGSQILGPVTGPRFLVFKQVRPDRCLTGVTRKRRGWKS